MKLPALDQVLKIMMRLLGRLVSVVSLLALTATCLARIVDFPQPDEVFRKAEVVCVAVAESITQAEEQGFRDQTPVKRMKARLRIAGVLKGRARKEIDFFYWVLDHDRMPRVVHVGGPFMIALKQGQRARFYLKKAGAHYVNAYEGQYDDGFTVDILTPGEPDRSLPMKREAAVKIARGFLNEKGLSKAYQVNRPLGGYQWGFGFPSHWQIMFLRARGFFRAPGDPGPPASIIIFADGKIDERRSRAGM